MSGVHAAQPSGSAQPTRHVIGRDTMVTGWVGWVIFGSVMMIILGSFQIIEGLVGVFQDGYYLVHPAQLVIHVDYTVWGWVHFGIGCAMLLIGVGLMFGQLWARVLGIGIASVSAIINLTFIAAYPVWAVLIITLDVLVIYAVAVHGRELKEA